VLLATRPEKKGKSHAAGYELLLKCGDVGLLRSDERSSVDTCDYILLRLKWPSKPPVHSELLCVYVGTVVQSFGMTLVIIRVVLLGFGSPTKCGGILNAMVFLWVFLGVLSGYTSSCLYMMFKDFLFLNDLIWGEKSSGAVFFGAIIALFLLWFGISVPEKMTIQLIERWVKMVQL
jgi:hypothetical protein